MKHIKTILKLLPFLLLLANISYSQESDSLITQSKKPLKLGLALSGGGAKGIAQIPILEALEKYKIPIHCISGTSIGSIVGGLYAMGYTPLQIKSIFFKTKWEKVLSDEIPRKQQAIYMKPFQDRLMFRLYFDRNRLYIPTGLVWGYNIEKMLAKYTIPAGNIKNFNDLYIPFSCVGTDLLTGEKKVFRNGDLGDAIRASMSIPSAFAPANKDGKRYLDGGLVANNPVQEAFDLGADIVLAVDISAPLRGSDEVGNLVDIMDQSISFSMYRASQDALKKTKFIIRPDISPFGTLDFTKYQSIYDSGTVAVKSNLALFEKLQLLTDTLLYKPNPGIELPQDIHIKYLSANGAPISEKDLFFRLGIHKNKKSNFKKINRIADRLYGNGNYEKVKYRLIRVDTNDYHLKFFLKEQKKNFIGFSHHYDSYHDMQWLFSIHVNKKLPIFDAHIADLKLGTSPAFQIGSFKWLPKIKTSATGFLTSYNKDKIRIFENKKEIANYKNESASFKFLFIHFIKHTAMIQFYTGIENISYIPVIGPQEMSKVENFYKQIGLKLRIDQLDDRYFPTFGYYLESTINYNITEGNYGYFSNGRFKWNLIWNINKRHVFFHNIDINTSFESPLSEPIYFPVGGFDSFWGFKQGEVVVRHYGFDTFGYRYKINSMLFWEIFTQGIQPMHKRWKWEFSMDNTETAIGTSLRIRFPFTQSKLTFVHSSYRDFLVWFEFGYRLDFPF